MALDENELEDAQLDLARQGGDERGKLEQAAQEHTAAQNEPAPAARPAAMNTATLGGQMAAWWTLGERRAQVQAVRQKALIRQGIDRELAKRIVKEIKDGKYKVQVTVQGDELRVSGKKRDDLQAVIQHVKGLSVELPLQYVNFRD